MIVENKLEFGYGDIAVGSGCGIITFQSFKPHAEVGSEISGSIEYYGDEIKMHISYEEGNSLIKLLLAIQDKYINKFIFKDYIFDFSYYNKGSIDVCLRHIKSAMERYTFCMAC